ncbi:hypothetical protein [Roseobacter weihaiensis]|uniref:hypothetical protein n=1 Tax=Roseobacter weihaiensis TaxID=2763262 RepID=UPI001D0AA156|nr:hypothetical protein [Roseobacter sp. H9]
MNDQSSSPYTREQLARYWAIIGTFLLVAAIAQPIVSSQLRDIPPEDLLRPMTLMTGGAPLPDEVTSLFAGVFANIQFSLAFAGLKLVVGIAVLASVRALNQNIPWPRQVLHAVAAAGVLAFAGIGAFFVYSTFVIATAMDVPLILSLIMAALGIVFAFIPARWLVRNIKSLKTLDPASVSEAT